ncbi:hypothetical protein HON22_02175 [Candidatus Peregrinibacteria bacterium]|jgi:MFS family permease|nr:hypothetical protein [Candidatus Peregrinibacteria bacterium]
MQKKNTWDLLAFVVMAVYFVQGAVLITGISEFILTRNAFEFSWIQIAMLGALSTLAWSIKPLYGFLTDLLPIWGSRRKYYLLICSLVPLFSYSFLAFYGTSFLPIALAIVVSSMGLGFADVIADGLVVERSTKKTVGWYQALCWRAKAVGIFLASLFSGFILQRKIFSDAFEGTGIIPWLQVNFPKAFPEELFVTGINLIDMRFTLLLAGFLPLITFVLALFLKEKKVSKQTQKISRKDIPFSYIVSAGAAFALTAFVLVTLSSMKEALLPFMNNDHLSSLLVVLIWSIWMGFYLKHLINIKAATKVLLFAALFLFLWRFTPSFGAPWSDYFINVLKLPQEKLGFVGTITPLAWIIGSFIYTKFLDHIPLKKILLWTVLVASALSLTQLTLASPDMATSIGDMFFIKYFAAIILYPAYFFAYGVEAWAELMAQSPILNLDAFLSFFLEMMFIIAFLPLLKLAATVTPKGVEATNFAVLASIMNLGLVFGSISGGVIYENIEGTYSLLGMSYSGLHITILIGALTSLICLLVLKKLRV